MPRAIATALVAAAIGLPAVGSSAGLPSGFSAAVARPTPTANPTPPSPQLHIAVDDDRKAAAAGDRLSYTIRVRNIGATDAIQLRITQSLPAGLTFVSADQGGAAAAGQVSWTVDLTAGAESTLRSVGLVGATPKDLLRLATVACATAKDGTRPLVCATHSDLLPAEAPPAPQRGWSTIGWSVTGAVVVVIGLAGSVLWRRRRRRSPAAAADTPGRGSGRGTVERGRGKVTAGRGRGKVTAAAATRRGSAATAPGGQPDQDSAQEHGAYAGHDLGEQPTAIDSRDG